MKINRKLLIITLIFIVIIVSALAYFFSRKSKLVMQPQTSEKVEVNTSTSEIPEASAELPKSLDTYEASLLEFKNGKTTLESVYILGEKVKWDVGEVLDSLSEDDLKIAERKMQGYTLYPNTETFTIWSNPDVFLSLAKANGKVEDVEFFTIKKSISSDGMWRKYIHQLTDLTGCTSFDGTLTSIYKSLTAYKKTYPQSYIEFVDGEMKSIESNLTEETCVCDSKEKVLTEMENFSKVNPDSKIIDQLAKWIENIKTDKADMTYNCGS